MKALVFGGPGQRSWDSAEDPGIQEPTDVIVKVDTTTSAAPTCTSSRATCPR